MVFPPCILYYKRYGNQFDSEEESDSEVEDDEDDTEALQNGHDGKYLYTIPYRFILNELSLHIFSETCKITIRIIPSCQPSIQTKKTKRLIHQVAKVTMMRRRKKMRKRV